MTLTNERDHNEADDLIDSVDGSDLGSPPSHCNPKINKERKKEEEEGLRMDCLMECVSENYHSIDNKEEAKDIRERSYTDGYDPSHYSDPLIEVYSVTISPSKVEAEAYEKFLVSGEIYVSSEGQRRIDIYHRPASDPEIIRPCGPRTLVLTGPDDPEMGVIKINGQNTIYINLKVQGLTRRHGLTGRLSRHFTRLVSRRHVWSAKGSLRLDEHEPAEPGYHQHKSVTLERAHVDVEVHYIYMPFARIAQVIVTFDHSRDDVHATSSSSSSSRSRSRSPDAYIYGKITAHYNSAIGIGANSPSPIILFDKERAQVHYQDPIDLCRSLVCIPSYSSLSLKLDHLVFYDPTEKHQIVFNEDMHYNFFGSPPYLHIVYKDNLRVSLQVFWFTTDELEISFGEQNNRKGASTSTIPKSVLPEPLEGFAQIQVLSFFVGHGGKEQVGIRGMVEVEHQGCQTSFEMDKGCPGNSTLVGLTSYLPFTSFPGNFFGMRLNLEDVGSGHVVDINNDFSIYEHHYHLFPGKWRNRPLCYVMFGKKGFAALHFILFTRAVKAIVKISAIFKDSNASCPSGSVYGTLVAQYGKYEYSTNYQRKYWSIDLFQEKDERSLPMDGEISLRSNVVSVPVGSSLILDADLYVSSGPGTCVDHFVNKVELGIGDPASRIEGKTYDVVVSATWESG